MSNDLSRYAEDGARRVADYRWPIVSTLYPRWCYVTTLVVDQTLWGGVVPTDAELAVVDAFHREYMNYWYRPGWVDRMRAEHLFDVDGGANGRYLLKVADGDWRYRKASWQHGAWPFHDAEPMDLLPLLDHIHTIGGDGEPMPRWTEWKQQHADVFAAVTA